LGRSWPPTLYTIMTDQSPAPTGWKWCLIVVDAESGCGHLLSTPIGYQRSASAIADSGMAVDWAPDVGADQYGGDLRLTVRSIALGGISGRQRLIRLRLRLENAHVYPWCYLGYQREGDYVWRGSGTMGATRDQTTHSVCSLRVDGEGAGWIMGQIPDVANALSTAEDSGIPVEWVSKRHYDRMPVAFRVEGGALSMLEEELRERSVRVMGFEWHPLDEDASEVSLS